MPQCIYCRKPTTGKEGRPHAIPEAVVANDFVMPSGSQCDACNNYLKKLDSALASYSGIALWIQALGLPGKKRRPRLQLGWFQRVRDSASKTLSIEAEGIHHIDYTTQKPTIAVRVPRGWKQSDFHRALHCVAFNCLSFRLTEQQLLHPTFDQVRNYIRRPKRGEIWPYSVAVLGTQYIPDIDILIMGTAAWLVVLRFFNQVFAVQLVNFGSFHASFVDSMPPEVSWQEVTGKRS